MTAPFPIEILAYPSPPSALVVLRVRASDQPIPPQAIVGRAALADGGIAWSTFRPNRAFVDVLRAYFSGESAALPDWLRGARVAPGEHLVIFDERQVDRTGDVPPAEIVGVYETDANGRPLFASFRYNPNHQLVRSDGGMSSYLGDPGLQLSVSAAV